LAVSIIDDIGGLLTRAAQSCRFVSSELGLFADAVVGRPSTLVMCSPLQRLLEVVPGRKRHQNLGNDLPLVGKAGKERQLAKGSDHSPSADRERWTFGQLLDWHLLRGTRPSGKIDRPGRRWSAKAFADAVGCGDRTVRYWLRNEHLPPETETIERVLFGSDARYAEWRLELRRAHSLSWTAKGAKPDTKTAARPTENPKPSAPESQVPTRPAGSTESNAVHPASAANATTGIAVEPQAPPFAPAGRSVSGIQPLASERRQLTVMSCDLVGPTLSGKIELEDLRDIVDAHHRRIAEV
jgi:hypothetical protein